DFATVNRAGKIAMKLEEGDAIVGVALCTEDQDVLLTTADARCIRFAVDEVRVFKGRDSTGVRGVRLKGADTVIPLATLRRPAAPPAERAAYLKPERAMLAAPQGEEPADEAPAVADDDEESGDETTLTPERIAELGAAEQFILTVADTGLG